MCGCPHHKLVPLVMVIVGSAFLLESLDVLTAATVSMVWPIGLILAGLSKLSGGMCSCCAMKKK